MAVLPPRATPHRLPEPRPSIELLAINLRAAHTGPATTARQVPAGYKLLDAAAAAHLPVAAEILLAIVAQELSPRIRRQKDRRLDPGALAHERFLTEKRMLFWSWARRRSSPGRVPRQPARSSFDRSS